MPTTQTIKKTTILCLVSLLLITLYSHTAFAANTVGVVLSVQEDAWAERAGVKVSLQLKSTIEKDDTLITGSTGKIQVLFIDDTTISLGSDTELEIAEFTFAEGSADVAFAANISHGIVRFVTGKVVEQNRDGFSVVTPQATVGIRGTTFTIDVNKAKGLTSVFGHQVNSSFPIQVTNATTGTQTQITQSGKAIDATPKGNTLYTAPAGQFSQSSQSTSKNQSSVASSETNSQSTVPASNSVTTNNTATPNNNASTIITSPKMALVTNLASSVETPKEQVLLASAPQITQNLSGSASSVSAPVITTDFQTPYVAGSNVGSGKTGGLTNLIDNSGTITMPDIPGLPTTVIPNVPGGIIPGGSGSPSIPGGIPGGPGSLTARYTGAVKIIAGFITTGNFAFNANLGSGSINGAKFDHTTLFGKVKATAGQGTIDSAGNIYINGFNIAQKTGNLSNAHDVIMNGQIYNNNNNTSGSWNVNNSGNSSLGSGNFTGNRVP